MPDELTLLELLQLLKLFGEREQAAVFGAALDPARQQEPPPAPFELGRAAGVLALLPEPEPGHAGFTVETLVQLDRVLRYWLRQYAAVERDPGGDGGVQLIWAVD